MQRYFNTIVDKAGNAIQGVAVTVRDASGNLVALYADNGLSPQSNPVLSDELGFYAFYAPNGVYTLSISGPGFPTRIISGVSLFDLSGFSPLASNYSTIQQAVNANTSLTIPASYAGTDTYSNPSNIPIFDLRRGRIGVWSVIEPGQDVTGIPLGNDLVLRSQGPADTYLEKTVAWCTTAATLSIGANASVLVGAVTVSNATRGTLRSGTTALFYTGAGLLLGRGTAQEELVSTYAIVDGTHITMTCAKTHSGKTTIEQVGTVFLTTNSLTVNAGAIKPNGIAYNPQMKLHDANNNIVALIPSDTGATSPYNMWQQGAIFAGYNGANQDLLFQNSLTASTIRFRNADGATNAIMDNGGNLQCLTGGVEVIGNANIAGSNGSIQIGRTSASYTTTTDAVVAWSQAGDPLNATSTAGTLVLAARNIANAEVTLATQNAIRMRAGSAGVGFNGSAPFTKPTLNGAATDLASAIALLNQIRSSLISYGLAQ